MPPLPTSRIIAPELRRLPHKITATRKKISGGATISTQSAKVEL
ncbi:Uncharacterised protein [Shigella flexneri]|nr:Uncharacterised protein [Shigella flexneri]